ncbi:phosphoribosyltransferase family protein [Novosphingobium beihaiensis]|uniref:Phosphoribosyltransferase n=1 Tax=Novosphingobium beihaiensis TaxID=2930389 RepID=A0ABT0BTN0_9SPHN|nr:phosphoribosyltransferase family protein [Novosphingobium beihaiensis]MCJ2188392.1 phosphoribosyltransferase [Novosphingobium beihaiensis]
MYFRSIKDLYKDVWSNLHRLPRDIDLVVGIPRSGMLPATMIALARNLPLADIDAFAEGRILASGSTRRETEAGAGGDFAHVLVIDDSCRTGESMREARAKLAALANPPRLTFAAVYGTGEEVSDADFIFADVPEPRVFEWNVLHHPIVSRSCFDIDGVLCVDPRSEQNDDGAAYLEFLLTAEPLHLPRREIAMLVTSRLEKYRPQTEEWLVRHGIRYKELRMLDLPDAATRRRLGLHGSFKAEVYRESGCALFIESELLQARQIAKLSGKPALSLQGPEMIRPGVFNPRAIQNKFAPSKVQRRLSRMTARLGLAR